MLKTMILLATVTASSIAASEADLEKIRAYLRIDDRLATAGQIQYDEIQAIQDAGFDVVVNLAPAREDRNFEEGFRVTEKGMTYIQIPVDWENPSARDLELFFDVMQANADREVFVHCFANMRVSVFVYLYRTEVLGIPKEEARADLAKIWDPATEAQWARFIQEREASN